MDKGKAMKVMAESHRETVNELEDRIYAIGESYRQEREYNYELEKRINRYREALNDVLKNDEMYISNQEIILEALAGDPHESS